MHVVYKYPFCISDVFSLSLPVGAQILSVQLQEGIPTLWARVNTSLSIELREFVVVGTGREIPEVGDDQVLAFIATLQIYGFVWHVFEVRCWR